MNTSFNRKGQMTLDNLGAIVIAIVLAVVIIAVLATVLVEIESTQPDNAGVTPDNETFTFINNTPQGLRQQRVIAGSVVVYNGTTKLNIGRNYTVSGSSITFINETGGAPNPWNGTKADDINVSYSYLIGSAARNTTTLGLAANTTMASFVPVIAIIAIAAIIIGIVLIMFGRKEA